MLEGVNDRTGNYLLGYRHRTGMERGLVNIFRYRVGEFLGHDQVGQRCRPRVPHLLADIVIIHALIGL